MNKGQACPGDGARQISPYLDEEVEALRTQLVSRALKYGPPDHAEDAAQETLCRALARKKELDAGGWLNVVVRNVSTDAWRANARARHLGSKLSFYDRPVERDRSEDVLDDVLARQAAKVVAELPPLQRDVITSLMQGSTVAEIAEDRLISPRSVEGHLRRARKRMRRWLHD